MRRREGSWRHLTPWVLALLPLLSRQALADDDDRTERVRMVLDMPGEPLFDRRIPASRDFIIEIPAPNKEFASASLELWPMTGGKCGNPPLKGDRDDIQHYKLAMTPRGDGDARVLFTHVPALQVSQQFCFLVGRFSTLTRAQADRLASLVSERLLARFLDPLFLSHPDLRGALAAAIGEALKEQGLTGKPDAAAEAAWLEFQSSNQGALSDLHTRQVTRSVVQSRLDLQSGTFDVRMQALRALPVPALPDGQPDDLKKLLGKLPLNVTPDLSARVQGTLQQLTSFGNAQTDPVKQKAALDYREALNQAWLARTSKADLENRIKDAMRQYDDALTTAKAGLLSAIKSDAARNALQVTQQVRLNQRPGQGQTTQVGNFASVDLGVLVGVPVLGNHTPWVVPYIGLNLYSLAVDRTIPFDQLAGSRWRQRLSLTLGINLTSFLISGPGVNPVVFDRYPLVALGYRISQYSRISAGVLFYWLNSANPAAIDRTLSVAPFIGGSLDLDVVELVVSTFNKFK